MKDALNKLLDFFGILSEDRKMSITNVTVITFLSITAFKNLFGGVVLTLGTSLVWTVQPLDMAATLPLLFGLLNYGSKRIENNKATLNQTKENV